MPDPSRLLPGQTPKPSTANVDRSTTVPPPPMLSPPQVPLSPRPPARSGTTYLAPQQAPRGQRIVTVQDRQYLETDPEPLPFPTKLQQGATLVDFQAEWFSSGISRAGRGQIPVRVDVPIANDFALFTMATLCRIANWSGTAGFDRVAFAFPDVSWKRASVGSGPTLYYEIWFLGTSFPIVIIADPGSFRAAGSFSGLAMVENPNLPSSVWRMWQLVSNSANALHDAVMADLAPYGTAGETAVFAGHGVGGCLAQFIGASYARRYQVNNPSVDKLLTRAVYTFGAPAFVIPDGSTLQSFKQPTVRVYNDADGAVAAMSWYKAQQLGQLNMELFKATGGKVSIPGVPVHVAALNISAGDLAGRFLKTAYEGVATRLANTVAAAFDFSLWPAHQAGTYTALLAQRCVDSDDLPDPGYTQILAANQELDAAGAP